MDQTAFSRYVREALVHLYDRPYLHHHALAQLLSGTGDAPSGEALHRLLLDAIKGLRPPDSVPANSPYLRRYRCVTLRYLEGATPATVARQLGVSLRQARRDHTEAVDELALVLWGEYRRLEAARARVRELADDGEERTLASSSGEVSLEAELAKLSPGQRGGWVDLRDTLTSALAIISRLAASRRVRFETAIPEGLPPVSMDGVILRQALLNSLAYAIELGQGERVCLFALESDGRINLAIRIPRDSATLAVRGKQAQLSTAEALLAASRRLVEAQGGVLRQSTDGDGIPQVILSLPTVPGITMLVIDDNPDIARLFRRFLRGRNYRLIHASTGQKALQSARRDRPDVITLDLLMPSQDGWDILAHLESHRETSHIPVIVCSILPDRELALSMGATCFLPKPVMQIDLITALESCTGLTRGAVHRG